MLVRLVFVASLCSLLYAQESGIPVIIDGREVVHVYGTVGAFSAAVRAPQIKERITALAATGFAGDITIRPVPAENATAVVAGQVLLMGVTEADAESAGVPQDELARRYAAAIQKAIETYRVRHSWRSFLIAGLETVFAWIVFCSSAWALWKAIRWLDGRIEKLFDRQSALRGPQGSQVQVLVWNRGRAVVITAVKFIFGLTLLSEFSFVISFTFRLFPQTAGVSTTLLAYLGNTFGRVGALWCNTCLAAAS